MTYTESKLFYLDRLPSRNAEGHAHSLSQSKKTGTALYVAEYHRSAEYHRRTGLCLAGLARTKLFNLNQGLSAECNNECKNEKDRSYKGNKNKNH